MTAPFLLMRRELGGDKSKSSLPTVIRRMTRRNDTLSPAL
jgi:hypothetical protein